jgi:hypothetical protein
MDPHPFGTRIVHHNPEHTVPGEDAFCHSDGHTDKRRTCNIAGWYRLLEQLDCIPRQTISWCEVEWRGEVKNLTPT